MESLTAEQFIERYITPAARELARKLVNGEPLSTDERQIIAACGGIKITMRTFYCGLCEKDFEVPEGFAPFSIFEAITDRYGYICPECAKPGPETPWFTHPFTSRGGNIHPRDMHIDDRQRVMKKLFPVIP